MVVYLLFFLELFVLYFLSRRLSSTLSRVLYRIFRSEKWTIMSVAWLFFPGVVIHELSHLIMAQLLFVPTGKIEFMPVLRGTDLKLGSVQVAITDPIRRAIIGVAPFLVGTTIILSLLFFYQRLIMIPSSFRAILVGYCIFEIGNTMFSSKKDLEGTLGLSIFFLMLFIVLYVVGVRVPESVIAYLTTGNFYFLFQQADFFLIIPLTLDTLLLFLLSIFVR